MIIALKECGGIVGPSVFKGIEKLLASCAEGSAKIRIWKARYQTIRFINNWTVDY